MTKIGALYDLDRGVRSMIEGRCMYGRFVRLALVACCATQVVGHALAADKFKRLNGAEIRGRIVGNVVTDQSHWSDHYNRDGTLKAIDLGIVKPGIWKVEGDEMCVVRKARKPMTECFEIWVSKDEVEYRRDDITLTSGVLRKE